MLLDEKEIRSRMESPLNLLNRLRTITNPHKPVNIIPALPPTAGQIIDDLDDKINSGSSKTKASALLNDAMDALKKRLPEVQKAEKLASIAESMSKIIERVAPARNEDQPMVPQIIIYAPQIVTEERFNVIDVGDTV